MNKIIIFSLIILLIPFYQIDGFETTKIIGQDKQSKIIIDFSDNNLISYSLNIDDYLLESINPKFKIKEDRFYIIDRENGIFIIGKNIDDKKWIVISKIKFESERITKMWIIDIEKPKNVIGQRDLLAENNNKINPIIENLFKESQLLEKSKKIDEAKRIYNEKLKRLESENKYLLETKQNMDYSQYEEYKKSIYDRDDERPKYEIKIEKNKDLGKMQLFLSIPKHIEWKQNLVYDVLVTDESKHKYVQNYNSFVGNGVKDVIVSTKIINSDKIVLHESDGNTDDNGLYKNSFLIPDRSTTRGEWTLEVIVKKSIKDVILTEKSKKGFFVNPISDSSFNDPPIAIIKDIEPILTKNQTQIIIDSISDELDIDAVRHNSTHFTGNSNFIFNSIELEYIDYDKLKQLLSNTDIVNDIDDNLHWNLNQDVKVILDGSNSYDVDDSFSNLKFLWELRVSETNSNFMLDDNMLKGSKPVIYVNAADTKIYDVELTINDSRKNSIPVKSSFTVYNGTLYSEIP